MNVLAILFFGVLWKLPASNLLRPSCWLGLFNPFLAGIRIKLVCTLLLGILNLFPARASAIEPDPTQFQIKQVVERGLMAAKNRVLPNQLYSWFGSTRELEPKGFLMTKMTGLLVMASHFGLRGEGPSPLEIERILSEETMLVNVTIFGATPTFARDSYMVLQQGEVLMKPVKVRFDSVAHRTSSWPKVPRYKAKVIGAFRYETFDPNAMTTILVFPNEGGEFSFIVDFSKVP